MPRMRKVVLTIECTTCLTVAELKDLKTMVFGAMRSDAAPKGKRRMTIKRGKPARFRPDILGEIEQVQVNAIRA